MTRAADEQLLRWLRQRRAGATTIDIANAEGIRPERVRVATNRVLDADRAEAGEPVAGAYWRTSP